MDENENDDNQEKVKSLLEQIRQDHLNDLKLQRMKALSTVKPIVNNSTASSSLPTQSGANQNATLTMAQTHRISVGQGIGAVKPPYNSVSLGAQWTGTDSGTYISETEITRIRGDLDLIKKRLMILEPNLKKMAKFQALADAYDHYLCMEKLCDEDMPGAQGGE